MSDAPKKRKKKKFNRTTYNLLMILIFLIGIIVIMYPTFSDIYNKLRNDSIIGAYEQAVAVIEPEDYSHIYDAAKEYNDQHTVNTFYDAFENGEYEMSHPYDSLLNPADNLIMGYIDVPKIGQKLAIGHGTGEEILSRAVGHIEGTSLPIGGSSTHAVLSGHTGLPGGQKIFTDLDELVLGDKFFLYILNDILAYEVDNIKIVLPTEVDDLVIYEGEDYVTLLTCTPYGVNSHRLLVRGHRIPYIPEDVVEQSHQQTISERERPAFILAGGILLLIIIIIVMELIRYLNKKKKKKGA